MTALEKWHADPDHRRWLADLLNTSEFQLVREAIFEEKAPKWYPGAEATDALLNAGIRQFRLEGLHEFPRKMEELCVAPGVGEPHDIETEITDEAAMRYHQQLTGRPFPKREYPQCPDNPESSQ